MFFRMSFALYSFTRTKTLAVNLAILSKIECVCNLISKIKAVLFLGDKEEGSWFKLCFKKNENKFYRIFFAMWVLF